MTRAGTDMVMNNGYANNVSANLTYLFSISGGLLLLMLVIITR